MHRRCVLHPAYQCLGLSKIDPDTSRTEGGRISDTTRTRLIHNPDTTRPCEMSGGVSLIASSREASKSCVVGLQRTFCHETPRESRRRSWNLVTGSRLLICQQPQAYARLRVRAAATYLQAMSGAT